MFIYVFCSKFAFFGNWFHAHFRCNGTSKPSLTPKPLLTIALKILKTIEKPLTPMVGPSKNIQWRWCNSVKTIERPLKSMVAWKKTLTIPSLWKIDHRCGLELLDRPGLGVSVWPQRSESAGQEGSRVGAFGWWLRIWLWVSWVVDLPQTLQWVGGTQSKAYMVWTGTIYPQSRQRKSKDNLY